MLRFEVVVTKLGDKMLQQSLDEICETQQTFRLRDAFRVLAWQVLETNPEIYNDLNLRYSRFYQKWNCSKIPRMNLQELEQLAIERGFSVEGLLFYRECYYSILLLIIHKKSFLRISLLERFTKINQKPGSYLLGRCAVRLRVNLPVIKMKKKIAISKRSCPSYKEFGINNRVGRYCRFEDGVWIHNDGKGDTYFSCEIPLCRNGDRLEFQGLYTTTNGDNCIIEEMKLSSGPCMTFEFMWENQEGNIRIGNADNFEAAIW